MNVARALLRIAVTAVVTCALAWTLAELAHRSDAERAALAAGTLPPPDAPPAVRAAAIAHTAAAYGLDEPAAIRVMRSVARLGLADLGRSWRDGRSVRGELADAAAVTLELAGGALVLALALGVAAGAGAVRRGVAGAVLGVAIALAAAAPPTWLALAALGAGAGATLPLAALILALAPAAAIAATVRAELARHLASPLAAAVRGRGAGEARVALHGVAASVRALAPLLTSAGAYALGAAAVVERAFGLSGLGRLAGDAAIVGDVPVLVGVAVFAGAAIATLSCLADLLGARVDPR